MLRYIYLTVSESICGTISVARRIVEIGSETGEPAKEEIGATLSRCVDGEFFMTDWNMGLS